jgi:integrase
VHEPRKLPVVLSREEAARLLAAVDNRNHQTALSVAYGAGLRASEVVSLKISDVDSQRMTLRIEQGKGSKDRYAMLSPVLLERVARLVEVCPFTRKNAARRLAFSWPGSYRFTQHAATESGYPCRSKRPFCYSSVTADKERLGLSTENS